MSANASCPVKSYTFDVIDERMYVILGAGEAVVVDPFECEEAREYISSYLAGNSLSEDGDVENPRSESGCEAASVRVVIFLTHSHFDHVSGVNYFKEHFNCEVICSQLCADIINNPQNETRKFPFLFLRNKQKYEYIRTHFTFPYLCEATKTFADDITVTAAGHSFYLCRIGGHSASSIAIVMDEDKYLFGGDNILGNGNELAFNDANTEEYKNVCIPFFERFEDTDIIVCPGHGEMGSMKHFLDLIRSY